MSTWWVLALATIVLIRALLWWQRRERMASRGTTTAIPRGRTTTVCPPSGGSEMIGPFAGVPGGGRARVIIHVKATSEATGAGIEIEHPPANRWEPVRERAIGADPSARDGPPSVGSWYLVSVPGGGRIRLTCPHGDGLCELEVTDVTSVAGAPFLVTPHPLAPACGAWGGRGLCNLLETPVGVSVTFNELCTDDSGRAANGRIRRAPIRPARPPVPPLPPLSDIDVPPGPLPLTWNGTLGAGYRLEAGSEGTRGQCSFTVHITS